MAQGRRLTDEECAEAARMRREGMTYVEMAVAMGASMFTARHRAQEARRRGMDCPEDVRRMRSKAPSDEMLLRLLERGASPKRIAAAAGVSRTTVYYWRKRAMQNRRACQ